MRREDGGEEKKNKTEENGELETQKGENPRQVRNCLQSHLLGSHEL